MSDECDITLRPPEPDQNLADDEIKELLASARTVAIVGLSSKPHRESFMVGRYLVDHRYKVFPVHPNIKDWEGLKVYKTLDEIKEKIDIVDIFRKPEAITGLAPEIIKKRPKAAWFQLGIVNNEAARIIRGAGIMVIQNKCMKIEHYKYYGAQALNQQEEAMSDNIGIEKTVKGEHDDVVAKAEAALKTEGFGILTRIDVKATLKEKLGVDFKKYVILGACNPTLAHKALTATDNIGLLLPCNVVVYEKEAGVQVVSAINPKVMEQALPGVDISEVSVPAAEKLASAIGKI